MAVDRQHEKTLFLAASDLADPAERAAYLDRACGGDAELRARVEALLAADATPAPGTADDVTLDDASSAAGVTLDDAAGFGRLKAPAASEAPGLVLAGKYKLLERIGQGGMGSVWLTQQSEPVKRKVAVKLIKLGMDSRQVIARFEAERQALAMMDHPNIAKVLDGGLTPDGRPFFVMELVKGIPITEYCDSRKLGLNERLELFVPVCQAIQHAHQKGIIHRDIKPSNVMVALYDDRPVPKVIDFGVAKATGQALTEETLNTGFGGVVGTPQYMSPEQATLNNIDVDTRSDVYSLGVLLYELLAGEPPFSRNELEKKGLLEQLRVVREDEPPKPSTRISTAAARPTVSANRSMEPRRLTQALQSELDWIVLKALEKDRARRYETANGLSADVLRYLSGEAVHAHPPGAGYRLRKFVRRHKGQVVAVGLVLATLLAGMAGTTLGLVHARTQAAEARRQQGLAVVAAGEERQARRREAERAEGERLARLDSQTNEKLARERLVQVEAERKTADAAKLEAQAREAEANAVVQFLVDHVFAAARPKGQERGLGAGVSLRDAVVASVPALETGFTAQPLVEARLRIALGLTFYYLAEYDQARGQAERARVLFAKCRGPDDPDTLTSMMNLAASYSALNRPGDALKLLEETLAIQKRVLPPDDPHTLGTMGSLANCYMALKRPGDALKLHEETLAIQKRVLPPDHPDTLKSMSNLSNCYMALNRPGDALKLQEETLAVQKRMLPPDHPDMLVTMNNLAYSYSAMNRPGDALKLLEETLVIQKRVLPPDHRYTLGSMNNLALCYEAAGRHDEARKLLEDILAVEIKRDPQSKACAKLYARIGSILGAAGRVDDAIAAWAASVRIDPTQADLTYRLSEVLMDRKRYAEALPYLRAAKLLYPDGDRGRELTKWLALAQSKP